MSEPRRFPYGCVVSPHYLASAAGLAVLADGGNAVDAAIATNLTLGVVTPYACGLGGDLFALVWATPKRSGGATGQLYGYNGSGRAPAAANIKAVRSATGSDEMPFLGPHSVTVPGAVEGWFTLLERFGTRSFADLAKSAHRYAREGFMLSRLGSLAIKGSARSRYTGDWAAEWRSVYEGTTEGALLRQPGLARTIDLLCSDGPKAYYEGPIAEAIAATLQGMGAFMSADDLAAHHGDWVEPLRTTYRDLDVATMPPNSQGIVLLETLNIIEGLDLAEAETAQRHHLMIEAMKLALIDRETYVTDEEHMSVAAAEIASKTWAEKRREAIDPRRANIPQPGRAAVGGTIYMCAADEDGMLVSLIQSNFAGFGSGVTVPAWGINLQNRGSFFSLDPRHANTLVGGKRTMHTLMPSMAFRDDRPVLVFGTRGGDGQAQYQLSFLTRHVDDGMNVQDALDAHRWFVDPNTWELRVETDFPSDIADDLRTRGNTVSTAGPYEIDWGHAHAFEVTEHGYVAGTDSRAEGAALGL